MSNHAPKISWYRASDGTSLPVRRWVPDNAAGDIVYLHGIISHSGWYESSCAHLAEQGLAVHFLDRRGSGLDQMGPADVNDWETWLDDVVCYCSQLDSARPRILLGISWGGILATALVRKYPTLVQGLVLICPGLFSFKSAKRWQRMALRLASTVGLENRPITIPLQEPQLFSNTPRHQQYIAEDPLTLRKMTIRFANANLKLAEYATSAPHEIRIPSLLLLAGEDPITDNASTRKFVSQFGSPDQTVLEYPNASHTLEFELDPSKYLADLGAWCRSLVDQVNQSDS